MTVSERWRPDEKGLWHRLYWYAGKHWNSRCGLVEHRGKVGNGRRRPPSAFRCSRCAAGDNDHGAAGETGRSGDAGWEKSADQVVPTVFARGDFSPEEVEP